jgi:putative MATE family efflux protein
VLLRLALPVLASLLLRLAYQWVDALWVRGLGVEATAAVTTSVFVVWWAVALNDVIAIGVTSYVSQLLGRGERARAGVAAFRAVCASGLLGLLPAVAGLGFALPIFRILDPSGAVAEPGAAYLQIILAGAPLYMMALTCESVMRASGDTRTPLLIDLGAVTLNAVLDPLLIYGPGPFPALGLRGAAIATVIAQALLLAGFLIVARRGHPAFPFQRRAAGPPVRIAGMARVGAPAALISMLFSIVYIGFSRSASAYGAASVAVVGMVNRIEALQFMGSLALGTAGAALVGQNLGAGRPDRAAEAIRVGNTWNAWITGAMSVIMLVAPGPFLRLFTQDPEAIRMGEPYLRVVALCFVPNGLEIVTTEAILGSGRTTAIAWIFSTVSLLRIPLGFLVPAWTGLGVVGIAWVIALTCIVRAGIVLAWAARGTWKRGLARELAGGEPPAPGAPGSGR